MSPFHNILGIHASFTAQSHDPSAALLVRGKTVAAIEEERLTRIKSSVGYFPFRSVSACLDSAGLSMRGIDLIAADGTTYPQLRKKISKCIHYRFGYCPPIRLVHHAHAHTVGAFLSSGFPRSLVVSVDGLGDRISTLVQIAEKKNGLANFKTLYKGDKDVSLGNFYTVFTNYLGFKSIEGEYKVMGMAAYGRPRHDLSAWLAFDENNGALIRRTRRPYADISHYTSVQEPAYHDHEIERITRVPRVLAGSKKFTPRHFDLAASVQKTFRDAYLPLIWHYLKREKVDYLCLAGGCALNCLANMELIRDPRLKVYVMPAASDRGLSLGAAMAAGNQAGCRIFPVSNQYLGKKYQASEILRAVRMAGLPFRRLIKPERDCAWELARGKVVGWFQGRAEFGPRALGHRSILASPRVRGMKRILNAKIKFRESYRPFAPAMLEEEVRRFAHNPSDLGNMTFTLKVPAREASRYPEAVHFDGTTRVQAVSLHSGCPLFRRLLEHLRDITGVGAVINTSFNLADEPIVDSPSDALRSFVSSGIDLLYLGNVKVWKKSG